MPAITIRKLSEETHRALKRRAAQHNRSAEAEIRAILEAAVDIVVLFEPRILSFDTRAAKLYAELAVKAREAGKGFLTPDGYIASIAAAHKFSVATRDTGPFKAANLTVINPWSLNP